MLKTVLYDIKKEKCARCGYTEFSDNLHVHHVDENRSNNDNSNLIILCHNCHMGLHRGLWALSGIKIESSKTYTLKSGIKAKQEKVAKGEDVWRGRGPDKQKRKTDGYVKNMHISILEK